MNANRVCLALGVFVIITSVLASHSRAQAERFVLGPTARAIVEANRPDTSQMYDVAMSVAFSDLLFPYSDFRCELDQDELEELAVSRPDGPSAISPQDAMREIDYVFRVLKYGYAGYQFFGGDGAFDTAKDCILKELGTRSDGLSLDEYEALVCGHMDFIQDGHLSIGRTRLCNSYVLFWNPEREFQRDAAGFFMIENGEIRRVVSIENDNPSSYLKPSINEDGDIVYVLGTVCEKASAAFSIGLEYQSGLSDSIRLTPMASVAQRGPAYERGMLSGMPLLKCRSFEPTDASIEALNAFIDDAGRLRNEPVIIIDIRSNCGGSSQYAMAWLWRLTYQQPRPQQVTANLTTDTAIALLDNLLQRYPTAAQLPKDAAAFLRQNAHESRPGWSSIHHGAGVASSGGPFVAVIIDSFVASAAETFILSLRYMDNVVFIGGNTGGLLSAGAVGLCHLPISGVTMVAPVALNRYEDMTNRDGLGLLPDFWVDPDDALGRVMRFLQKHLVSDDSGQPAYFDALGRGFRQYAATRYETIRLVA
ncbi:MAG: S41 family peptidase [Clostridia bacterium]|nr:S41 family peptidase [Clostridia bacterium]